MTIIGVDNLQIIYIIFVYHDVLFITNYLYIIIIVS
jgi:hypothetical protein